MNPWLPAFILLASAGGLAKAHHFIRLVVLAGLGLAGLWMVHTLAQDYNNIQQHGGLSGSALGGTASRLAGHFMQLLTAGSAASNGGAARGEGNSQEKYVYKRSINDKDNLTINWELVMSRDPASCARSFVCQLAANKDEDLTKEELLMLEISRTSASEDSWASKQLQEALKNGEKVPTEGHCMKIYKFCPYSRHMMMTLLRIFGS